MNIYNRSTLVNFWKKHANSKKYLELWYDDVSELVWKKPADVKKDYITASIIANDRVVFNIKGNSYRLVTAMDYQRGWTQIKFIGTHEEYDRIDAETIDDY
jgi:mRNA interferase HigB